jgi:hypothetical protein
MDTPKKFYRYETVQYATHDHDGELVSSPFPNPTLQLREFNLHKETPKGYWISYGGLTLSSPSRWISKTSKKRYAYPTKEEALNNFIKRKEYQIKLLEYQLSSAKIALSLAKNRL